MWSPHNLKVVGSNPTPATTKPHSDLKSNQPHCYQWGYWRWFSQAAAILAPSSVTRYLINHAVACTLFQAGQGWQGRGAAEALKFNFWRNSESQLDPFAPIHASIVH